jgi:hypothetical protein
MGNLLINFIFALYLDFHYVPTDLEATLTYCMYKVQRHASKKKPAKTGQLDKKPLKLIKAGK